MCLRNNLLKINTFQEVPSFKLKWPHGKNPCRAHNDHNERVNSNRVSRSCNIDVDRSGRNSFLPKRNERTNERTEGTTTWHPDSESGEHRRSINGSGVPAAAASSLAVDYKASKFATQHRTARTKHKSKTHTFFLLARHDLTDV